MTEEESFKTLTQAMDAYPSYNLRTWVGGIHFTATRKDFDSRDLEKFRGNFYVDHNCNEIDLSNKEG